MKKRKLLALLSVLMIAAMLLSSCGFAKKISKVSSFEKFVNAEYEYAEEVVAAAKALTELNDYAVVNATEEFALLASVDEEDFSTTYKVFSYRTASVVLTLTTTEKIDYAIEIGDVPAFVVMKTEEVEDDTKTTYTAYDATGAELLSTKYAFDTPSEYADLVLYGNAVYSVADDGKLTKAADVPENLKIGAPHQWNDEYFYFFDDGSVQIFDRNFAYVSSWYAPSSIAQGDMFVLDNGDVLIQYMNELDAHAEKFDFYWVAEGETAKYDLVTKLMTAKNGKVKDIEMDYVIETLISAYELREVYEEDLLAGKVENVAYIRPIVDQKIDYSESAMDAVLMNNKGKILKSAKIVDDQYAEDIPELVADGVYLVKTLHGDVLTDAKGEVLVALYNSALRIVGDYIVGEQAIYDLSMNKVYDLRENDAMVMTTMDNTVFVMKGDDTELAYEIIAFCGGEQKTVATFDVKNENNKLFVPIENADVYAILDEASEEYTYYSADGKELMKTKALLAAVMNDSYDPDTVLLFGTDDDTLVFYALTK